MAKLTKEEKADKAFAIMKSRAEFEALEQEAFTASLPGRLLNLVARASKFADRMQVEFQIEKNAMSLVTFWDKSDKKMYAFTYELATQNTRWELQEVEEMIGSYEWEEAESIKRLEARRVALAKLTPDEKELLGLL